MREYFYEILPEIKEVLKWIIPRGKGYDLSVSGRGKLSFMVFLIHHKENFFNNLKRLILYISQSPHSKIEEVYKVVNSYEVKHIRPYDYEKFLLAERNLNYKFYNYRSSMTVNTPENRFLAFFVDRIIWDLEDMIKRMDGNVITDTFKSELDDAHKILREFKFLRDFTFLKYFDNFPNFTISERITHKPIYAKVFSMFLNYGGYITYDGYTKSLDKVLEDWRIFELYVFFKVKGMIEQVYGKPVDIEIPKIESEMEPDEIFKNWRYKFNNCYNNLWLYYQYEIPRYIKGRRQRVFSTSLNLKPDVVISIGDNLYIFDAKHKDSPDDNDYRQMHTYRDAIRVRVKGKSKKAVRFAIMVVKDDDILKKLKGGNILSDWEYIRKARVGYIRIGDLRRVLVRLNII